MNINASIIDQRLTGVQEEIRERVISELGFGGKSSDKVRLKSLAFVYLCVKTKLDLDADDAFDCLTEGGGDFGVDAIHVSEEIDGEFVVTLFQGKYKQNSDATSSFDEKGIKGLINAIRHLFDPSSKIEGINDRLRVRVETARSMIRDGAIPRVRAIACNNGLIWTAAADNAIKLAGFGEQATWEHLNHDNLINILGKTQSVNDTLRLTGKAIVEDMNFSRVCIGRIPVTEIAALMKTHGDKLLERNIRRYLGLKGNRVNEDMKHTLLTEANNFYLFNNGLTLICDRFKYNGFQGGDYQVQVEKLQIVNGGQTCMTISKVLEDLKQSLFPKQLEEASVLVRLYELSTEKNEDIVWQITNATNSQNPVDLKDLKANDVLQKNLENSLRELNYEYRRKRMDAPTKSSDITSGTAAEAILSIWRRRPHQAKFFTREHFGKLYDIIFTPSLNGAQTIIAVLLYRIAENHRRRPLESDPLEVRYGSCFIAMRMGQRLIKDLSINSPNDLSHLNFSQAQTLIEVKGEAYYLASLKDVQKALKGFYRVRDSSMQQLSATFRRGDLITTLESLPIPLSKSRK
jgi:hypothetical protein